MWPLIILAVINLILVNLDFEILVIILSPLLFICYCGFAIAFVKIRKDYPIEKRGDLYHVKGKFSPVYIVVSMCIVGLIGLLMNGTEYFLMGYVLIIAAIIFYLICKNVFGGCAVEDPENYPLNTKTRLCKGDLCRFGTYFLIFGVLALFGSLFLGWYEADWGPDYYLDLYKSGLISNFWLMINIARWLGIGMIVLGFILKLVGKKIDPIPEDN